MLMMLLYLTLIQVFMLGISIAILLMERLRATEA